MKIKGMTIKGMTINFKLDFEAKKVNNFFRTTGSDMATCCPDKIPPVRTPPFSLQEQQLYSDWNTKPKHEGPQAT